MSNHSVILKGLTWGHRRAMDPLLAASERFTSLYPEIKVEWRVRSLEDFEHQPIGPAMEGIDFLVFDHPFCGAIEASGVFATLNESRLSLNGGQLKDEDYIGPSLASYRYEGNLWGLPIDGATNHAVYRNDLVEKLGVEVPNAWSEVLELGQQVRQAGLWLGMGAKSHHGLLALAALMGNRRDAGRETKDEGKEDLERDAGRKARDGWEQDFTKQQGNWSECKAALDELMKCCHPDSVNWTSIDLHEQMVAREDVVYCPVVYGYATYGEADHRKRLSFANFPGLRSNDCSGSILGGAGIGLSDRCNYPDEAYQFLQLLNEPETQGAIFPAHHGQPARIEAWNDPAVDARFNGYFSSVRRSMETAWIRPRFDGYLKFQLEAGNRLEWV